MIFSKHEKMFEDKFVLYLENCEKHYVKADNTMIIKQLYAITLKNKFIVRLADPDKKVKT